MEDTIAQTYAIYEEDEVERGSRGYRAKLHRLGKVYFRGKTVYYNAVGTNLRGIPFPGPVIGYVREWDYSKSKPRKFHRKHQWITRNRKKDGSIEEEHISLHLDCLNQQTGYRDPSKTHIKQRKYTSADIFHDLLRFWVSNTIGNTSSAILETTISFQSLKRKFNP